MFRLWIERRFSRPVTAAGAVLKPQGGNCAVLPKRTGNNKSARTCNDSRYVRFLFIMCLNGKDIRC